MAWMKSVTTGKFYLTGEFTVREDVPQAQASGISDVLGFETAKVTGTPIKQEIARVKQNRAALVKEITDAVLAGISAGITVTADIDEQAIAEAVEAQLADEFDAIPGDTVDELRDRLA